MNRPEALTCREFIEFLAAYLDGEISAHERERFEAHLSICPRCVDYLNGYRETIRVEAAAFRAGAAVPEDVPEELVRAILASRQR